MWQIIGSGAIGCLWAANLSRADQQVNLITRKDTAAHCIHYQNLQGKKTTVNCAISTKLNSTQDPILVCVKAPNVAQALGQHLQQINKQQAIILMHNGMGCAEQVSTLLPNNPIICATTANASLLNSPLNITHTGIGPTYLGAFNQQAYAFSDLTQKLNRALDHCHWCEDIKEKLWLKLLINSCINPLTAIFQVNNGVLMEERFQLQIAQIINELMPVLIAEKLPFNESELIATIKGVIQATAQNYSSMNRDIFYKRATENEYINGYLLKKAKDHDVDIPQTTSLYRQLKKLESK